MPHTPEVKPTVVIFRAEWGMNRTIDVTAVFPTEPSSTLHPDFMTCYTHFGQHGSCTHGWYLTTRPAKPEEYADLKAELERLGYKLKVCQRITKGHRDLFHANSR